jgi:vitamin B12 transporter
LAALFCSLSTLAYASEEPILDEIVVTATRIEQPLKQTLSSTSIITRKEIQDSQAVDLPSILKSLAGVEFYQSGGIGKQSSIFMRGTNSNQVLVLLDGVRINSATSGSTAIDQIMLDHVERIEVVRGNVSSLYGSDAIGGVIQIFTRKNLNEITFNGSAGVGSNNSHRASAGFGGQSGDNNYNIQVSRYRTDGISAINTAVVNNANPDNDGYDNTSFSANVRHAFTIDHNLSIDAFNSEGLNQYDNSYVPTPDTNINENKSLINKLSLTSSNRFIDNWVSKLQISQASDEYKGYSNSNLTSGIKTTNNQSTWQNTIQFSEYGKLLLGVENLNQKINSTTAYIKTERIVNSGLVGFSGNYVNHQLQMNARQDRYSDFGDTNTGLLGYGYIINENLRVTASTSNAFRAPTFNDLFYPGTSGNPNLIPERSVNNEAGLHYTDTDRNLDLVYFDNQIRSLIIYSGGTTRNLNLARISGTELNYSEQFDNTHLTLSLTRQNPRDSDTDQLLLRRAQLYSNISLAQQFNAFRIAAEWQYSGEREDTDISTYQRVVIPSYNLINMTTQYKMDKHFDISLRADNILNQNYVLAHGYNTLGRILFINMSYQ